MPPHLAPPLKAAIAVVERFGVRWDRTELLQDGHTLVVRLSHTLVARVVTDLTGPRQGTAWFERETALACHLTQKQAPVIPLHPDIPQRAHRQDGYAMNFWLYIQRSPAEPAARPLGAALAACHEAMRDFSLELPRLGILYETLRLLQHSTLQNAFSQEEIGLLGEHLQRSTAALEHFPHQPLHGDAHLGNVIAGAQGVLWTDWEDAFSGPVEWDVASAIWNAKLLEADPLTENDILTGYTALGAKLDPAAMRHSLLARAAVMSAWYPVLYPNPDAARRQKLALRMAWLRQELSNPT